MNPSKLLLLLGMMLSALALGACGGSSQQLVDTTPTVGLALTSAPTAPTESTQPSPTTVSQPPPTAATAIAPTATLAAPRSTVGAAPTASADAPTAIVAPPTATSGAGETPVMATEQAVAPEQNPLGDISDSQAFVTYSSASGGYQLEAPEGWGRAEDGANVSFIDKLDGVSVVITTTAVAPQAANLTNAQATALLPLSRAVIIAQIKDVQLAGGAATLVAYSANSDPNAVTGKQVRLEVDSYFFFKNGKLAILTVWAPLGADNVDQWQRMAGSFRWTN